MLLLLKRRKTNFTVKKQEKVKWKEKHFIFQFVKVKVSWNAENCQDNCQVPWNVTLEMPWDMISMKYADNVWTYKQWMACFFYQLIKVKANGKKREREIRTKIISITWHSCWECFHYNARTSTHTHIKWDCLMSSLLKEITTKGINSQWQIKKKTHKKIIFFSVDAFYPKK